MQWYLSKIIFRIVCGDGQHVAQFDEQLRLVAASDKEEAFRKAVIIGQNDEETFFNNKEQLVKWEFINVSEIYQLTDLIDGAELYSRIEEKDNADAYIYTVNQKAGMLFSNSTHSILQLA